MSLLATSGPIRTRTAPAAGLFGMLRPTRWAVEWDAVTIGPGQTLLQYRLVEKIGEGAMGAVWRALDTDLEREAAIKVLPEAVAGDPSRLARFQREAKLMATLQHPNVAAVYGVHEADGVRFLAMEYVPGEDLSVRIARGALPVEEAVRIACGITQGLEAAHASGVVHRDLKPANVRVLPNGTVKVLDFGLAKAVGGDGDGATDHTATLPGTVVGTAPYMSPEQVRGQPLDTRSDVWSFGCVLWESLTGRSPFLRDSAPEVLGAILHAEPDLEALPPGTPEPVRRVLERCLAKDPDERLHHIADARIELSSVDFSPVPRPGAGGAASAGAPTRARRGALVSLALLCLALAAGWAITLRAAKAPVARPASPLEGATFTKLTAFPGVEFDAAISPDGKWVAFVSDHEGEFEAYVGQIGEGDFQSLTRGWVFEDVRAEVRKVGFVGDGSEVWLSWMLRPEEAGSEDWKPRMKAVSLQGGDLRSVLVPYVVNADWSGARDQVVYHLSSDGDPLYVAHARGGDPVEVPLPTYPGLHQHHPIWSPDGAWIYMTRGRPATGEMQLWRCRPDGADLQQLTDDKRQVMYPTPLDDHTVLYIAQEANGAGPWLWALDLDTGVSRRATLGVERYASISASRDGRRLVATVSNPRANLWTLPLGDEVAEEADVTSFPLPRARALSPRIRGDRVYFLSSEGSADGLWCRRGGETRRVWRGVDGALLEPCAVSPDGARIAIVLRQEGRRQRLYVMDNDGTSPVALSEALDARGAADWSPKGDELVVGGLVGGLHGLFRVPLDGGRPVRIASGEALNPVWSPRGDLIVYGGAQIQGLVPLLGVTPDGQGVELPEEAQVPRYGERFRFLPDGSAVVYMKPIAAQQDFWRLDVGTMEIRRLTRLQSTATMRTFDVTPDGKTLLFDRVYSDADIVLIERAGD